MTLTQADVAHIAHLARLDLTEAELAQYREQLTAVLDYAARLDELDLDDVPPTAHAVTQQNVMGEDVAEPSLSQEDALRNAPDRQDHQFRIQAVLDDA